jgi:hypothetical protein
MHPKGRRPWRQTGTNPDWLSPAHAFESPEACALPEKCRVGGWKAESVRLGTCVLGLLHVQSLTSEWRLRPFSRCLRTSPKVSTLATDHVPATPDSLRIITRNFLGEAPVNTMNTLNTPQLLCSFTPDYLSLNAKEVRGGIAG